jgi:hypothetical protein
MQSVAYKRSNKALQRTRHTAAAPLSAGVSQHQESWWHAGPECVVAEAHQAREGDASRRSRQRSSNGPEQRTNSAKGAWSLKHGVPHASATPQTHTPAQPDHGISENGSRPTPRLLGRGEHCRKAMGVTGHRRVPGPGSRGRRCRGRSEVGRRGCLANKALKRTGGTAVRCSLVVQAEVRGGFAPAA